MYCCINCFQDRYLKKFILDNGTNDNCDYCSSKKVQCIDTKKLCDFFVPLIETYDFEENFLPADEMGSLSGRLLSELLQDDWEIFSSDDYDVNMKILKDMFNSTNQSDPERFPFDSYWRDKDEYWGIIDEISTETTKKWETFKNELIYKNRFFISKEYNFKSIEKTLRHLIKTYIQGSKFYRARKCSANKKLNNSEMGMPTPKITPAGRANPQGIPYLYLGDKYETCIAEIRPYKFEFVTMATFELKESATLIDLRSPLIKSPFDFGEDIKYLKFDAPLLRIFNKTLSEPIEQDISHLEYLPSQYLCELIKNIGYEGIVFDSSQYKQGYNIVFFNDKKLICKETKLFQIDEAIYTYKNH